MRHIVPILQSQHPSDRHYGLDPESRGAGPCGGRHTGFKAVSTGRGNNKTTPTNRIPLSLDGRGIKGEGEQDKTTTYRHTGFKAVSTGQCPRHCGLDPQSRGAVTRHAEYLLDTTVAQARSA